MVGPTERQRNVWRKKLDENYTSMLRAVLNKSWKQYSKKNQHLYDLISSTSQTTRQKKRGCHHGVMVKAIDYEIVESKFELQLRY